MFTRNSVFILTPIWVGSLRVRFDVGEGGKITPLPLSKTCYNYARNLKFGM